MKAKTLIGGFMFASVLAPVRVSMLGPVGVPAMAADGGSDVTLQHDGGAQDDFFRHRIQPAGDTAERGDDRDDHDDGDHHDRDHHHHHHRHHHSGDHDEGDDDGGHGDD
jgi:hypothetical protein